MHGFRIFIIACELFVVASFAIQYRQQRKPLFLVGLLMALLVIVLELVQVAQGLK